MNETLGKWHFWTWLLGFNLTFGPMHMSGLLGQPRRTAVLPGELGPTVEIYNLLSTVGLVVLFGSALLFLYNLINSAKRGLVSGLDPWDARTLEWLTASPPAHYNFAEIPVIRNRDEFWHRKYVEDDSGRAVAVPAGAADDDVEPRADDGHDDDHHIHMPDPSYWPLVQTLGFFPLGYGLAYANPWLIAIGGIWLVMGLYGWIIEPVAEGDDDEDDLDHGHHGAETPARTT
jgi:cytochrome c oxidase subunit I